MRLSACPHPFRVERIDMTLPAGLTIAEMVAAAQPDPALRRAAHVFLGDHRVPQDRWHLVRPKPGATVCLRVVPLGSGGEGGKDPLRTVLTIAVIAAAFAAPALLPAALAQTTVIGSLTIGNLVSIGVGVVGSLLVNAIAPPSRPKTPTLAGDQGRDSPTLSVTGTRNEARPFGVVPRLLGRHRMFPPLGALPYTEIVGDDQYLRALYVWGIGPLDFTDADFRIRETPLSAFADVEAEHRQGFPDDPPLTLFPDDVYEEPLQVLLKQANGWSTRTTQPDADEISIDIAFLQGLVAFGADGRKTSRTVSVEVEYRPAGGGSWSAAGTVTTKAARTSAVRRGLRWKVTRGQYEVRLRRATADTSSSSIFDLVTWTALRTFTNEDPVQMPGLAMTVLRIRATDQLSGIVDLFNGVPRSIVKDWDSVTQTWIERATSNPASLFREVLQGAANARALPDARVDLDGLQVWHDRCVAEGWEFNMVRDFASSIYETLSDIAAAGRASIARRDGKWGVVLDEPGKARVQLFTPRNSFDFAGQKVFQDLPHAFRVRFQNRDKDWRADERIVYRDGYDAANATEFEGLELAGVTDPDAVWRHGRYHLASAILRPETYGFSTDLEYLVCQRGDMVGLSHDVILVGLASGRIKGVTIDGGGNVTALDVDEALPMESGKSYGLAIRTEADVNLTAQVVTDPGEQTSVTLTTPIPAAQAPAAGDLFAFGELGQESIDVLVKQIVPGPEGTARLTCLDYAPTVHDADTGPIPAFESHITDPPGSLVPAILAIESDERVLVRDLDGSLAPRILITLGLLANRRMDLVAGVETQWRVAGSDGPWEKAALAPADATEVSLFAVEEGETYELRLRYALRAGDPGPWTAVRTHTVVGKTSPPPDVTDLRLEAGVLRWSYPSPPPDFAGFVIRTRPGTVAAWDDAAPLTDGLLTATQLDASRLPGGTLTVLVKAVDVTGRESANAAVLIKEIGDPIVANLVLSRDYAAEDFPGTLVGGSLIAGALKADDTGGAFWSGNDEAPFWGLDPQEAFWTQSFVAMTYTAELLPDAEAVPARLRLDTEISGGRWELAYRSAGESLFWGANAAAPFWSADGDLLWSPADAFRPWPGAIDATRQRYELQAMTAAGIEQGVISGFAAALDVPDIVEHFDDVVLPATGARLPIAESYRAIKNVQLTLQDDGGDAESVKILDKDAGLGPLVRAFDGAGAGASALIDASVQGY